MPDARTKIVATVGPACDTAERLAELIQAGASVFRINTAHGHRDDHQRTLDAIREASQRLGVEVAVLLDLAGPKIRLGTLVEEPQACEIDQRYTFVRGEQSDSPQTLTSSYKRLIDELAVGDRVMLADGTVAMEVESVSKDSATCIVRAGGMIRSRQGINLPGAKLSVSSMLPKDVDNAIWGASAGVDWISLSFVRSAEDVHSLKKLLATYESTAMVVAKIEKPEALENLEAIVDAADGVMVARGDLGVEIDVAETPVAQKRIIRQCRQSIKPVIVATQMLESMHHSPRPTRAEASDVANAILDGADACMLSGETAIGQYPVQSVAMMRRIMAHTESQAQSPESWNVFRHCDQRVRRVTSAVTAAANQIAQDINAKLVVIVTHSGNTAWIASQSRSRVPTIATSDRIGSLRRMNLFWGIRPVYAEHLEDNAELVKLARKHLPDLTQGDRIVLVKGTGVIDKAHNTVMVHTVE